jgi:hypothetical protein
MEDVSRRENVGGSVARVRYIDKYLWGLYAAWKTGTATDLCSREVNMDIKDTLKKVGAFIGFLGSIAGLVVAGIEIDRWIHEVPALLITEAFINTNGRIEFRASNVGGRTTTITEADIALWNRENAGSTVKLYDFLLDKPSDSIPTPKVNSVTVAPGESKAIQIEIQKSDSTILENDPPFLLTVIDIFNKPTIAVIHGRAFANSNGVGVIEPVPKRRHK